MRPRLDGSASLIRYADDAVMIFEHEADARRVMAVLAKRFARYGLTLHPTKTRLIDFRRPTRKGERGSFDFLGFTHFWGRSRRGYWVVQRKTASSRFGRALKRVVTWCRSNRHRPVAEQHKALVRRLRGHYNYFGITGNSRALGRYWHEVRRAWRKWLDRRSSRKHMKWDKYALLLKRYPLPRPRIVHSFVNVT